MAREGLSEGRMEDKRDTMREERNEVGGLGQPERKESERKGVGKIREGWVVKVRREDARWKDGGNRDCE